ncbi:immunity 42 family protein [Caballeronia glebae]|uniref:immunity 42 family protein n=1 Tax=Caballeronia glebae TaxID=1777143 RepID=UPI0038BA0DD9
MMIGNPDSFAIWCDSVPEWSNERFKNGCFAFFIDGRLIWSLRSTLSVDLHMLETLHCMRHGVENEHLFHMPLVHAYNELLDRAFPDIDSDAEDNDFTYLVSAESLSDDGYNVFLVEFEEKARLIYGSKRDVSSTRDLLLKRGEFQLVVREAIKKYKDLSNS